MINAAANSKWHNGIMAASVAVATASAVALQTHTHITTYHISTSLVLFKMHKLLWREAVFNDTILPLSIIIMKELRKL